MNTALQKERDLLLFGEELDWSKIISLESYTNASPATLDRLIEIKLLDPNHSNDSPTVGEFIAFMKKYPGFTAHGWARHPRCTNAEVVIEGIAYKGAYSIELLRDFTLLCRKADSFVIKEDYLYCWFD